MRMKKDKPFREAVMQSTYFNLNGSETLLDVNNRYAQPFKMPTLYRHMQRHQAADIQISEKLAEAKGVSTPNWQRRTRQTAHKEVPSELAKIDMEAIDNTVAIIEGGRATSVHEQALDEFISIGRAKMDLGQVPISAANYIAAIKIKADIEKGNKDRKVDLLKNMFSGAAPKHGEQ
jgi:lipopolysaccharide biosynthesis regulator YciM